MNSIKVYVGDTSSLKDEILFEKLFETVPSQRKEKINRISRPEDKRLSLGVELLLKKALSDIGIDNYKVERCKNGKPCIKGEENLFFNLSHSGERVMCAVSSFEIGCDVEKIKPTNLKIAKRFFFENEYKAIAELTTEEEQQNMFFRLWTLKESYMKMTGEGMSLGLDRFEFDMDGQPTVKRDGAICDCHIKEYELPGYKLAVCAESADFAETLQYVNTKEILV